MITLVPEMIYRVRTTQPSEPTRGSPRGTLQYWKVSAASLKGERISAKLLGTGGDWMEMSGDGFWRPDVRAQFITNDGETVLMHYTGLVEQSKQFKSAAEQDLPTRWEDQYMRLSVQFITGARKYAFLNRSLYIGEGRLLGTGRIEYAIYRVG
jgi:Protein of unknown function (DUF3237)